MTTILVAYATKHQATAEIAEVIAEELRKFPGLKVDVRDVETVTTIAPYEAVVLGSAVYAGQWQSSAAEFLKRQEAELARRPTWLFSSGPTGQGDPKDLMKGWVFPDPLKPVLERIAPRGVVLFHGRIDPDDLNFLERSIVRMVRAPWGDSRDWDMIRAWACTIGEALAAPEIV